ncbi:TolC family protein [Lysobacter arvi]|uniref:TolC family protein n=1 Tax=Lysobacter arvi TaxID=3038776 RepID=A0ABU1CBF9_9GAMM|nr:TolC family protein [Lysobacter arvi]MDR0181749.1 TolC family protein [Lysobacter arvi]
MRLDPASATIVAGTSPTRAPWLEVMPEPVRTSAPEPASSQPPTLDLHVPEPPRRTPASARAQWLSDAPAQYPWSQGELASPAVRQEFWRLVQAAASYSPKVRQAEAEHQASLLDLRSVKGQRWPQVTVGAGSGGYALGGGKYEDEYAQKPSLEAQIVTPVYDFGRLKNTIASYRHLADASEFAYNAQLQAVASEVSATAIDLIKTRMLVEISTQYVDRLQSLVDMLQQIVQVDVGRGSELTQAKARFLQAQANRDAIVARVLELELQLRRQVGDVAPPDIATENWEMGAIDAASLMSALASHPTVLQAQAEVASAQSQADAIRSSSLPSLNWVVSKTTQKDALGQSQPWETRLSLDWSAFRGGAARAQRQAALARAESGRQRAEQQRLDLEFQVRNAIHNAKVFSDRADAYRDLIDENDRVRRAFFQQWYHLGRRTLLDVLSAESDYYTAQINEVGSRMDGYRANFDAYAYAGMLAQWLQNGN